MCHDLATPVSARASAMVSQITAWQPVLTELAHRALAGRPGHRNGATTYRWLRCGPFAPLPQKRRATRSPGDSCLAKLGPASWPVNTPLWMTLWTTWGESGVSLWTAASMIVKFVTAGYLSRRVPGMTPSTACGQEISEALGRASRRFHDVARSSGS